MIMQLPQIIMLPKILDFLNNVAIRLINAVFPPKCLKCSRLIDTDSFLQLQSQSNNKNQSHNKNLILKKALSLRTDPEIIKILFSEFFCNRCIEKAEFVAFKPPFCIKCGAELKTRDTGKTRGMEKTRDTEKTWGMGKTRSTENYLCKECIKNKNHLGKIRACGMYKGILRESIHLLKYNKKTGLSRPLGILLFSAFEKYFSRDHIDLILPVPLHRAKLKKRGFNQSFLIVKDFKKLWEILYKTPPHWKIDYNILARQKNTKSQTGFDKKKRKENIKGAFKVTQPDKIKDKHILLVDDVYTTGATAGESASVLLDAKALSVDVLVVARA